MDTGRQWRRVLLVFLLVATATVLLSGVAAGATSGVDSTNVDGPLGTEPLANESGPTEVVVRFTPVDEVERHDPGAVVDELETHAAAEQSAFAAFAGDHDAITVESEFWLANAMVVTVDPDAVDAADLLAVSNVTHVHENVEIETLDIDDGSSAPDGAVYMPETHATQVHTQGNYTPGLELIGTPAAWERFETRGAGATVAVIDTGVDPTHRDIDLDGWAEFDENGTLVADEVADARDPIGHGTHVAGTVAGGDASGTQIGVAPDAGLYGINTFGEDGSATFASVLASMEHATANEAVDVLQMSLGTNGTFGGFVRPVRNARAADKIVVAASGNAGHGTSASPANTYDALAVGAVRDDRGVATFSSGAAINTTAAFGGTPAGWPDYYVVPDVTAPGVGVRSAEAGTTDGYVELQGTSMAAPHVGGIAALAVAATDGRIGGDDLQSAIVDTAVHPDGATEPDDRHGHGVVDAEAAVEAAVEATPPSPTPTPSPAPTPTPDAVDPATTDDASGFGVITALVAAVALLVAARSTCDSETGVRRSD